MQIVPLEAAHLFDLNAAILGWLLAAVQPKKQHPQHSHLPWWKFMWQNFRQFQRIFCLSYIFVFVRPPKILVAPIWVVRPNFRLAGNTDIYQNCKRMSWKVHITQSKCMNKSEIMASLCFNPHQNDQGWKGPCFFQRLIALKCLKCQKI